MSAVWIIPIVAALVGIGIAVQRYLSEGPTIRITFQSGEGIEAGKTAVKYKDIEIGKVTEVHLAEDRSRILVTAEMEKNAEGMLDNDARFWIVKPRVTLSGISGIGALISGNYIGFEPGRSREKRREFVGLEAPPPVKRDRPGREFVLRSGTLGSLGIGSPVYYRRLGVGEVVAYDLAKGGEVGGDPDLRERALRQVRHAGHPFLGGQRHRRVGGGRGDFRAHRVRGGPAGGRDRVRDAFRLPRPRRSRRAPSSRCSRNGRRRWPRP